jgi:hypothetical protein
MYPYRFFPGGPFIGGLLGGLLGTAIAAPLFRPPYPVYGPRPFYPYPYF